MLVNLTRRRLYLLGFIIIVTTILSIPTSIYAYNNYNFNKILNSANTPLENENFDDALEKYTMALKFKKETDLIKERIGNAEKLKLSKASFDLANQLFTRRDYIKAIEAYKEVDSTDVKYYKKSADQISNCQNLYITDNLNDAKKEADKQNIRKPLATLSRSSNLILQMMKQQN